jgi:hypothetical protein
MVVLLNNCNNNPHAELYGEQAFFDLWSGGREDSLVAELRPNDVCWVLSYGNGKTADKATLLLRRAIYSSHRRMQDPGGSARTIWVLDGRVEEELCRPKTSAATDPLFGLLFNKRGHFKQLSFMRVEA